MNMHNNIKIKTYVVTIGVSAEAKDNRNEVFFEALLNDLDVVIAFNEELVDE